MKSSSKTSRVVIQGGFGAFHEIAARYYFGKDVEIVPARTFKDLFKTLHMEHADYGIMAIENSLVGSILPNYGLLQESKMKIIGEIYLRIEQNLVALPGQKITDIKEVYSHPMAILQCQNFFEDYKNIKLIDSMDTALSAKEIHDRKLLGVGAIASKTAAKNYGLEIVKEGIETNKKNYTRFLILTDKEKPDDTKRIVDKSSICFSLAHQIGSLSKILSTLSYYDINLTKIQSMPVMGHEWEYQFYIDVTFDDYNRYKQSLEAIRPFTKDLKVMGEYEKGKTVSE